ncbi:hypothetical protein IT403_00590 [Candidatus Nomurabacteria bacterium]|nr:hypothetical protein [Candidatus Nomurabacteria bacterium]
MKPYEDEKTRDLMYLKFIELMKDARDHIYDNDEESKNFYNSQTHHYIEKQAFELCFPLEKEKWPQKFQNMERHYEQFMIWPNYSTYCYIMDVVAPPLIPSSLLHFGYACVDNKLVRATFFVVQQMVKYQEWPQGMVIDPLALMYNIQPEFYVGYSVPKEDVQNWMIDRKNPLELYLQKKSEKEHEDFIYRSYMESYMTQMTYEPEWFPSQLIEFAKKENLYIPPQKRE